MCNAAASHIPAIANTSQFPQTAAPANNTKNTGNRSRTIAARTAAACPGSRPTRNIAGTSSPRCTARSPYDATA